MSTWSLGAWAMGVVTAAAAVAGCSVDTSAPTYTTASGGVPSSSGGGNPVINDGIPNPCTSIPSGAGSSRPMLVDVDTNRTLHASGGGGVGVFTEYTTGGHWHIWWTCDTNVSGLDCQYAITVSVASGSITSYASESLESGDTSQQCSALQVAATTNTGAGIDGITFDTSPSAVITVDAQVNGAEDGSIMFFVQNGIVNGGYTGTLTDPLMFEPASP